MKLLVSACLLGDPIRYDGKSKGLDATLLQKLQTLATITAFCPEHEGGLSTPRPEAQRFQQKVLTVTGEDITQAFEHGAQKALQLCKKEGISCALLKEKSPSCGSSYIYDGTFSNKLITGQGVTASLLKQHHILVFSEENLDALFEYLQGVHA